MKKLLLCLLVISYSSFSQTEYSFDYLLQYNYTNHIDSTKSETIYYLTNSKDNSYLARITNKDSLNLSIQFLKHDLIFSDVVISKKNFQIAEFINIECKNVRKYSNPFKYKVNDYDYIKLETSDVLEKYEIICIRSEKYRKKIKIGKYVLKFNTTMPFHLPNLFFSTLYEEWNKERDLPNYFLSEISFINFENKLITSEEFIEFTKIDKKIKIITEDCGNFYLDKILKIK
jgi:hypothetical protein